MLTNDLIRALCSKLGHEEGAAPCVKKLVNENWLQTVDDLSHVPRSRLEKWGIPLKLISEIEDFLADRDASETVSAVRGFVNYRARPVVRGWISAGEVLVKSQIGDDGEREEREENPQEWAAKKVQRWFRARRARRLMELTASNAALEGWLDREDFGVMTDDQAEERRKERAKEKLIIFVRRWKKRRDDRLAAGMDPEPPAISTETLLATGTLAGLTLGSDRKQLADLADSGTIPSQLLKISRGRLKECRVWHLVRRIAQEAEHSSAEVKPYAHRLVTLNWIEDIADLELVEDRHWEAWAVPEKVVIEVKAAVRAYMEERVTSRFKQWFGWG